MLKGIDNGLKWLWIAVLVILVDQFTKVLAMGYLASYQTAYVLPFFNFTLAFNKGAAFSFLSDHAEWSNLLFIIIALSVSVLIMILLRRMPIERLWGGIGYALVLGGALGNVIDRVRLGFVVDFLDFHIGAYHWPAFNIADAAICVGVAFLIVDLFKFKEV